MHYPRELFDFKLSSTAAGTYCLYVSREPTDALPTWVQLQLFSSNGILIPATAMGSIDNPAESNEEGMLSVGATDGTGNRVESFSARGPAPEPPGRQVLDLVGPGGNPNPAGSSGTSFASPRVAGESALVVQALGDREEFDKPAEIAQYMKDFGSTRRTCSHEWGCGFAILPPLDPPTNVTLGSTFLGCRASNANVSITLDPPTSGNPDVGLPYFVELRKVGDTNADPLIFSGVASDLRHGVRIPAGENYVAEVHTCVPGVEGEQVCGAVSAPSTEFSTAERVCRPVHFDLIPGERMMTLRWDSQPDATEYEVEQVDADGNPVAGSAVTTTDQHLEFSNLADRVVYSYRLRAKGPSGTTAWSDKLSNHTGNALGSISPLRDFREFTSHNRRGRYDAVFGWLYGGGAALHEVQIREVGTQTWTRLSSDPTVAGEGPRVFFTRDPYQGGNFGSSFMYGAIAGLVPGTEYEARVRGINGSLMSPWTDTASFKTLGQRPSEGDGRPPVPDGLQVIVNAAVPFSRVMLGWVEAALGYRHEVRVIGGGIDTWGRLPHQPAGWGSEYSVLHPNNSQAFITGLIPGTEYRFAVRSVKELGTDVKMDRSPWSKPVTVTTPGDRPSGAPGSDAGPALKAPPEDLMAVVNGTTVELTWTATTNPNYTSQRLLRRVAGVSPIDWTEIPLADVDVTTYTDTGLTSGVTYRYRVRAYKDSGNYGEEKGGFVDAVIP